MILEPKQILPKLHDKTHFKAAQEYSMGNETVTKAMHDPSMTIQKQVIVGKNNLLRKMQKIQKRNEALKLLQQSPERFK